ncbi:VanZ family protein [Umezawaea endophytica]|uniref:VanZ family protein n=1 Tax=Umezawaea endophytica TaxID=1654476 RepID=A0A9X2VH15_9PSEU|nr:VanZ family protein [Umezawaea endophytica]MCS7475989.1 VanZ family protein [Umezawaea endophytica]
MSQWTGQTLLALLGGFALAFVLVLPFVARSYRLRGTLGIGRAVLGLAFLVYALALVTYTLLPQPVVDAQFCAANTALAQPVWNPLEFLSDMRKFRTGLLSNPALQQVVFNAVLFMPWGFFLRRLFGKGVGTAIATGFGVSLLIECTQLTGVWFLFQCPYRLFDTGDLLFNTLGAAVGALLTRPAAAVAAADAAAPRPVTTGRRVLGMVLDLIGVTLAGVALVVVASAVEYLFSNNRSLAVLDAHPVRDAVLGEWLPAVVLLLVVPLFSHGATPGQRSVRLRPEGPPVLWRALIRFLTGSGGYFLVSGLETATGSNSWQGLLSLWLFASLVGAWRTKGHRGLSGVFAGLRVVDSREVSREPVAAR